MEQKTQASRMRPLIRNKMNWELIEEYLAVEKARLVQLLHTCSESELKGIQGELRALDNIQRLPSQLEQEQRATR